MAKQGFYGREYVKDENGDYDYKGQVNRLHNLVQWDRQSEPMAAAPATVSLDEMQERWKAHEWLIKDDKHWESKVIKKVDEIAFKNRHKRDIVKPVGKTKMPLKTLNKILLSISE